MYEHFQNEIKKMFEINSCAGHAYACAITCF